MADFRPFAALRYAAAAGDPSLLIAPPYDVVSPDEAAALHSSSPHNISNVDFGDTRARRH